MTVTVRQCTDDDRAAWDAFVESAPQATFFHRFGWRRVLQDAFGHTPYFLLAEEHDGQAAGIVGLLPLALVRSRLFGNKLAGLPFCVYGGIVASSERAEAALRAHACELAEQLCVDLALDKVDLLGPVASPMERRAGRYRAQLLVQAPHRSALHQLLHHWLILLESHSLGRKVRWSIDVDPLDMF